jgi:predicted CopG family antitoxin
MPKILTITISDEAHAKLREIKRSHQFNNNAELLEFLIFEVARKEEKQHE